MTDTITPDDFGLAHHGVHLFTSEDGSYIAHGHHEQRRIMAAINRHDRSYGLEPPTYAELAEDGIIVRRWINHLTHDDPNYHDEWTGKWCDAGAPDAIPVTVVWPDCAVPARY